ncbi:MAG: NADH-quinone oxidoreductase subunit NuoE [Bacteroidales bacterium]
MIGNTIQHKIYERQGKTYGFSETSLQRIHEIIERYPEGKQKSALLPILHIAQEEFGGSLNADIMDYVASLLSIQPIEVYEVATFYSQFYMDKVGKYVIEICQTGPCIACGAEDMIDYLKNKLGISNGETTADGLFTLKAVECLGGCGNAPVMQINTRFHENLTKESIDKIIELLSIQANEPQSKDEKWVEKFCLRK